MFVQVAYAVEKWIFAVKTNCESLHVETTLVWMPDGEFCVDQTDHLLLLQKYGTFSTLM